MDNYKCYLDSIIYNLLCPICNEYFEEKCIYMCRKGHSICDKCKTPSLRECPFCCCKLNNARNLILENIAKCSPYPCKFSGCQRLLPVHMMQEHLTKCSFRKYCCPMNTICANVCDWKGKGTEIINHFGLNHPEYCWSTMVADVCRTDCIGWNIAMLETDNQITFGVYTKYENSHFYWVVQYIGEAELAKNYRFKVQILGSTGEFEMTFINNCVDDGVLFEECISTNKCFVLPELMLTSNNCYYHYSYTLNIITDDLDY